MRLPMPSRIIQRFAASFVPAVCVCSKPFLPSFAFAKARKETDFRQRRKHARSVCLRANQPVRVVHVAFLAACSLSQQAHSGTTATLSGIRQWCSPYIGQPRLRHYVLRKPSQTRCRLFSFVSVASCVFRPIPSACSTWLNSVRSRYVRAVFWRAASSLKVSRSFCRGLQRLGDPFGST